MKNRVCFACGKPLLMADLTHRLWCEACEIFESCDPPLPFKRSAQAEAGPWKGVEYLDHSEVYAPTP